MSEEKAPEQQTSPQEITSPVDAHLHEIDHSNAADAELDKHQDKHQIPFLDYSNMALENLVGELQRLVKNESVSLIKRHVDAIKNSFDQQYQALFDSKKEEYLAQGGVEMDFKFSSVDKRQFNEVYKEYREKRADYYQRQEIQLKNNLAHRWELIERLKGLISMEEDINTTYNNFKVILAEWKNAGPIPRDKYNDVWRTYHHHMEIFYDFLNLNRELRDLDFKHNLEEKLKLVVRAEELAELTDIHQAFQELQVLHKIWKEDLGPVDKEHRNEIWDRFSKATKTIHDNRQAYFASLDKDLELNLHAKEAILEKIKQLTLHVPTSHKEIQNQIKAMESLRQSFMEIGKVPSKQSDKVWKSFKELSRTFNKNKNNFFKNIKKDQNDHLTQKRALLEIAQGLVEAEINEANTAELKRIQAAWKEVGHVPRKFSDALWKDFKSACNAYFERLQAQKKTQQPQSTDRQTRRTHTQSVPAQQSERSIIRKKIEEEQDKIRQLENNLAFFSHVPDDNPVVKDVQKKIDLLHKQLDALKEQLKQINIQEHQQKRAAKETDDSTEAQEDTAE